MRARHRVVLSVTVLVLSALACTLGGEPGEGTTSDRDVSIPLVLLIAPVNNSTFTEGTDVEFYALSDDTQGRLARLEFRVDDIPVGETVASVPGHEFELPARMTWTAAGVTKHLITVEAFNTDDLSLGLKEIVITVIEPLVAGAVSGSPVVNPAAEDGAPVTLPVQTPQPTNVPQFDLGILTGLAARVIAPTLNLRQGPDTTYPAVGSLERDDRIQIIGRNADSTWWAVLYRGGTAWIFAELVEPEGDVSGIPLVASPD